MEITLAVSEDQKTVTLTAVSGQVDIANLYLFQNEREDGIINNLLTTPGFIGDTITFTASDLPILFDDDSILNTGYLIAVVTNAAEDASAYAVDIGTRDLDCCIANMIDTPYEDLDTNLASKKLDKASRVYLLIRASKAAANAYDLDGAVRYLDIAQDICNGCGCNQATLNT